MGLRFYHDVPDEKRIFLELANGALYPIERTWADGGQAGYRFATPVMLGTFVSEAGLFPHRAVRLRLRVPVLLTVDGEDCRAMLADISRCGAKVVADRPRGGLPDQRQRRVHDRFDHEHQRRPAHVLKPIRRLASTMAHNGCTTAHKATQPEDKGG